MVPLTSVSRIIPGFDFCRHPDLTTGQKRYLCSIANVYSTEHMRTQIRRQYLNMLQPCMQTGMRLVQVGEGFGTYTRLEQCTGDSCESRVLYQSLDILCSYYIVKLTI
ncbi:UNVERIFIED_CONTAM: hypothetical protein FKN15_012407 [Acipenser sinensis]